jgi:hypothetical protein
MNPSEHSVPPSSAAPPWRPWDLRTSLAARAALTVGLGGAAFAIVLSWAAGTALQGQLERHLGSELETFAFQLSDKLDRSIYERSREVSFATNLAPFRDPEVPATERRRVLEAMLDASPDFAWLAFANAEGKITSATQGFQEKADVSMRPWFRGARELPYTSELREVPELAREITRSGGEAPRFLALATPVLDPDGRFLGVIVAEVRWAFARDMLASVLSETARRERISLTIYAANGESLLDSGSSGWTEPPAAPTLTDPRKFRGAMWENVAGDTAYLTGFARSRGFREFRGLGTMMVARRAGTDVFAPVDALRRTVLGWGLALAAGLAVASWVFAARVARRLHAVGVAAQRIRLGDVLSLLPHAGNEHELTRMCRELDLMVGDFREKQAKLDPSKPTPGIFTESRIKDRDVSKYV